MMKLRTLLIALMLVTVSLQNQESYGIFTKEQLQNGAIVLHLVGILYFSGIIFILYQRFINAIIEDQVFMIDSDNEVLRPIVYCILSGTIFIFICLSSLISKQQNLGVATIIASDYFNFLFLFAVIVKKYYENQQIDSWIYIRDGVFYCLGIGLMALFYINQQFNWYMGFVMLFYYFMYYFTISKNEKMKEMMLKILGIINEDDDFNADEHFLQKRRRYSISQLVQNNFILEDDEQLISKLNRQQTILKINLQDYPDKYRIYFNFRRLVIKVIFGIRNSTKNEKRIRCEYLNNIMSQEKKKKNTQQDIYQNKNNSDEDISPQKIENNNQQHQQQEQQMFERMNYPIVINQSEQLSNLDQHQQDEQELFIAKFPSQTNSALKLIWIIYSPVILIISLFPDHKKHPNIKKLIFSTLINASLLFMLTYFIVQWCSYVNISLSIPSTLIGTVFLSIIVSVAFILYNLDLARVDKEVDFMQSFMQLAIYKLGMGVGITWVIAYVFGMSSDMKFADKEQLRYGYALLGLVIIYFIKMLVMILQSFKLTRNLSRFYLFLWFCSILTVLISILI